MKIALVNQRIIKHDAVSYSVRDKYDAIKRHFGDDADICIYAMVNQYDWPESIYIKNAEEFLYIDYAAHDVYIFEWAIYNQLIVFIRLIKACYPHIKVFVHFHNVSPIELVADDFKPVIVRSHEQFDLFHLADQVWVTSEFNRRALVHYGVDERCIEMLPPAVQFAENKPLSVSELIQYKQGDTINLLYVGRFVILKNIPVLIKAIKYIVDHGIFNVRLSLVGSSQSAQDDCLAEINTMLDDYQLHDYVTIVLDASEAMLVDLYKGSAIFVTATQHEGFCVPIVEALYYGCYPIAYDHSNLPYIINGLGVTVEADNESAFLKALLDIVKAFCIEGSLAEVNVSVADGAMTYNAFIDAAIKYASSFSRESYSQRLIGLLDCHDRREVSQVVKSG